jgi:hypothetical protein
MLLPVLVVIDRGRKYIVSGNPGQRVYEVARTVSPNKTIQYLLNKLSIIAEPDTDKRAEQEEIVKRSLDNL